MNTEPTPQPKAVTAAEIVSIEMPPVTGATVPAQGAPAAAPSQPAETAPKPETAPIMHNGRAYDPARFRLKPDGALFLNRHGQPMPKGGRKPKTGNGPVSAQPQTAPQPSYIPPEPPAPKPETGNGEPQNGNGATAPETAQPGTGEMPAASAKSVAEVATNAGYALTGAIIGDPKAARPSPAEHANLRDTAAAYIEARGLRFVGGAAIIVGIAAYILGEDRRDAIFKGAREFVARMRKPPMKTMTPVANQEPSATAAEPKPSKPAGLVSAFGQ